MPFTSNKNLSVQSVGSNSGVWGGGSSESLNTGVIEIVDLNLGGTLTKSLASTTPVTLTSTEARNAIIRFTGTLSANITIRTVNLGFCYVQNSTTGSYTVSMAYYNGSSEIGSAIECPQGYTVSIITDATNGARRGDNAPGEPFVASGASHAEGLVPDPGATAGTGRYLREDATFVVPPFQWAPGGRLTLTTGVPVTTGDVTAAGTVYYTAMTGSTVPVYGSCASAPTQFAPVTITGGQQSLTLNDPNHAANTNYDIFEFLDSSTPRIGTGPPWTSSTARGTGAGTTQIEFVSGIYVNSVSMTARNGASTYSVDANKATYLGTIRTGSTAGTTNDSVLIRGVFNAYNQVRRNMSVVDATNEWNYTTATWRQANGSTANQFTYVQGLPGSSVSVHVIGIASQSAGSVFGAVGVGIDSTSVNSAQVTGAVITGFTQISGLYEGNPGLGYHTVAWLEISQASGNTTWKGDSGLSFVQSGMVGNVIA